MADLIMTIDSDSESDRKPASKKQAKQAKGKPEAAEEEILLAHSVILHDTEDGVRKKSKLTTGHTAGSNNLWNFAGSLQLDQRPGYEMDNDMATTADEKAPFLMTLEERVASKMQERKVTLPQELLDLQKQTRTEKDDAAEVPKEDAKIHYDKEDLISFH